MSRRLTYKLLYVLVLFMPFHYYICELFIKGTSVDNLFRDILILSLFVFVVIRKGSIQTNKVGMLIVINSLILIVYASVSYLAWHYHGTFNVLRTYVVPMLIYFICASYKFTGAEFGKLQKMLVIEMAVIGLYGTFQAFILGDRFAIRLGYPSAAGHLSSSSFYIGGFFGYQRNTGTFVSPNICGAVLMTAFVIHLLDSKRYVTRWRSLITLVLAVSMVATFSRSAMVGGLAGLLFYGIASGRITKVKKIGRKTFLVIAVAAVGLGVIWIADQKVLGGLFSRMVLSSWRTSVTGTDSSLQKHITDLFEPLGKVIEHPFGMGFGSNGPMSVALNPDARNVESSIYLMMYEIGIFPALLFFVPYIGVIISTLCRKKRKYYVPAVICMAYMIIYVILPSVQSFELIFYSFMYMGFYYNPSVRVIYERQVGYS